MNSFRFVMALAVLGIVLSLVGCSRRTFVIDGSAEKLEFHYEDYLQPKD